MPEKREMGKRVLLAQRLQAQRQRPAGKDVEYRRRLIASLYSLGRVVRLRAVYFGEASVFAGDCSASFAS